MPERMQFITNWIQSNPGLSLAIIAGAAAAAGAGYAAYRYIIPANLEHPNDFFNQSAQVQDALWNAYEVAQPGAASMYPISENAVAQVNLNKDGLVTKLYVVPSRGKGSISQYIPTRATEIYNPPFVSMFIEKKKKMAIKKEVRKNFAGLVNALAAGRLETHQIAAMGRINNVMYASRYPLTIDQHTGEVSATAFLVAPSLLAEDVPVFDEPVTIKITKLPFKYLATCIIKHHVGSFVVAIMKAIEGKVMGLRDKHGSITFVARQVTTGYMPLRGKSTIVEIKWPNGNITQITDFEKYYELIEAYLAAGSTIEQTIDELFPR
jgi:hypothetical protein